MCHQAGLPLGAHHCLMVVRADTGTSTFLRPEVGHAEPNQWSSKSFIFWQHDKLLRNQKINPLLFWLAFKLWKTARCDVTKGAMVVAPTLTGRLTVLPSEIGWNGLKQNSETSISCFRGENRKCAMFSVSVGSGRCTGFFKYEHFWVSTPAGFKRILIFFPPNCKKKKKMLRKH